MDLICDFCNSGTESLSLLYYFMYSQRANYATWLQFQHSSKGTQRVIVSTKLFPLPSLGVFNAIQSMVTVQIKTLNL